MAANLLITGPPGCGKSTVLSRTADRLTREGLAVGGLVAPQMTTLGARVGFRIEDLASGQGEVMAHVDHREGPRVGKYRVNVEAVDRISELSLATAREEADVIVIDEIAPMEVFSDVFIEEVRACLDGDQPVLAAIHRNATDGFIGEVKARSDIQLVPVGERNRDDLPAELAQRVLEVVCDG